MQVPFQHSLDHSVRRRIRLPVGDVLVRPLPVHGNLALNFWVVVVRVYVHTLLPLAWDLFWKIDFRKAYHQRALPRLALVSHAAQLAPLVFSAYGRVTSRDHLDL